MQSRADVGRVARERPEKAKRREPGVLADEQAEMPAAGTLRTEVKEPASVVTGDPRVGTREDMRREPDMRGKRCRLDAELFKHGGDRLQWANPRLPFVRSRRVAWGATDCVSMNAHGDDVRTRAQQPRRGREYVTNS